MKKFLALLLAVTMIFALVACGNNTTDNGTSATAGGNGGTDNEGSVKGKTVVFVPKLTGNAFFESANDGAQKYSKDWGFTVDYQGSSNAAVADQVQVINNAIASGADAICVSSVDATGLDAALKDAIKAGMTVVNGLRVSSDARTLWYHRNTRQLVKCLLTWALWLLKPRRRFRQGQGKLLWHYSQATNGLIQNPGRRLASYIERNIELGNVASSNYYSEQDAEKAFQSALQSWWQIPI
jgi:AI-2 transport system substrate-binding protein